MGYTTDGPLEPIEDEAFDEAWALLEQQNHRKHLEEIEVPEDETGIESMYEEYVKMNKEINNV